MTICGIAAAQKDPLKEGNAAFQEDKFREALIYYNQIEKINKSAPILYKRGVCYYEINQLDKAIADFRQAWEYGYKKPDVDYYVGLIQHHKGNFQQAAEYYKNYLRETPTSQGDRDRVRKLIRQCGRALDLSYRRPIAIVERGPNELNSAYDEINMIESPSVMNRFYFTSNQPTTSFSMSASDYDIYSIQNDSSGWSEPKRLPYAINKSKEDVLLGFTPNAEGIYFYRGEIFDGQFFLNTGHGNAQKSKAIEINQKFDIQSSDAFLFDSHLILFSARRPNGYGGLDLYYSKLENGTWSEPENLGSRINSNADEVSPFLSQDGTELYFSSNREDGIGGHDVFYSSFLYEGNHWDIPSNLGIPINSPGNDDHFVLSKDGLRALFSSNRKSAYGGRDIFIARFKSPRGRQQFTTDYLPFADYSLGHADDLTIDTSGFEDQLADENSSVSSNGIEEQDIPVPDKQNKEENTPTLAEINDESRTDNKITNHNYSALYYASSQDILLPKNQNIIAQLSTILESSPNMKIEIQCHSSEDGILEFKLFSSIKMAERVKKEFMEMGIEENRILVKGFADNYPIAISEQLGGDPIIADKFNNRIEFKFFNYNDSEIKLDRAVAEIPSHSSDRTYDLYRALSDEAINYKIQLAIVSQMYRGMALDLFNDATVEKDEKTGLYLYTIGLYDNFSEALEIKRDIEKLGLTDTRILPYYDGRILENDQISYYVDTFPDLRNYMNYGN